MPRLSLAIAASMLGGALLALVPSRPALAADPPGLASGDGSASAACGQGHLYVCSATVTFRCLSWDWSVDPAGNPSYVCTKYTTVTIYEYRD